MDREMIGWSVAAVLLVVVGVLTYRLHRAKQRRRQWATDPRWPISSIDLPELDPVFTPGRFGPGLATEVAFMGRGSIPVLGGTSDTEAWVLAVLAKGARRMFEFGTCTGKTTYLWSRNAPEEARVVTLTLAPAQRGDYDAASDDTDQDISHALEESAFEEFLYTGTPAADRITQLYGDSKRFDESEYLGWADLVFVDGSHARSYVDSDSQKAMRIVRPGGLVLWHDYAGPRHAPGVFQSLNALASSVPLRHVRGTTFVAWRRPVR